MQLSLASEAGSPDAAREQRRALRFQLARLLRASEHMLCCARQGDWEAVEAMERDRRRDLEACFAHALDIDASEEITEAIAAMMHINEEVVRLVGEARRQSLAERQSLDRGRQAARTYAQGGF